MKLFFLVLVAALAVVPAPAGSGGRVAGRAAGATESGAARVVRLRVDAGELASVLRRIGARGFAADFVLWREELGSVVGAGSDATLRGLEAEGIAVEPLFDTIVEFQAARDAGRPEAAGLEQPSPIEYVERVVVVDLELSTPGAWVGDPEMVLRANERFVAVLDAGDARDPDAWLAARYRARGLAVLATHTLDAFAARSEELFPENPFAVAETKLAEGRYTSYAEATAGLEELAAAYPSIVRLASIGQSYEGRELWAVKLSSNAAVDDPAKPDVLFTGLYHAREWITVDAAYGVARRLAQSYDSDPHVRFILDTVEVWVVPIVNPDGLTYSQTATNHSEGEVRNWRKNRRPIDLDDDGRPEGLGVDLNRNHRYDWRIGSDQPYPATGDDHGGSDDPGDFTIYRGPAPDSEPEIRALNAFTTNPAHQFVARVDFHNYGQLVLYPLGARPDRAVDHSELASTGRAIADAIESVNGTGYSTLQSIQLYPATGTSTDHAYGDEGQLAFTVELSPVSGGFDLPETLIDRVVGEVFPGALALADWATGAATVESFAVEQGGRVVFRAHWERAGNRRAYVIDEWSPIVAGEARVIATFSRPLSRPPSFRLVASSRSALLSPSGETNSETWAAVAAIRPDDGGLRLEVSAPAGAAGVVGLDSDPSTVATYAIGEGAWTGLESGRPDMTYVFRMPPGQDASPIARLRSPGFAPPASDGLPAEVFAAGTPVPIVWESSDDSGIAEQRVEYSIDGGASWLPTGVAPPASAREAEWVAPAGLHSASVLLRLTVVDTAGNATPSLAARPIAISRVVIAGAPAYAKGKLRISVPAGALRGASSLVVELDGTRIDLAAVRWKASSRKVTVRGTLAELGLQAGVAARARLVVDGVPTPPQVFVP